MSETEQCALLDYENDTDVSDRLCFRWFDTFRSWNNKWWFFLQATPTKKKYRSFLATRTKLPEQISTFRISWLSNSVITNCRFNCSVLSCSIWDTASCFVCSVTSHKYCRYSFAIGTKIVFMPVIVWFNVFWTVQHSVNLYQSPT